MLFGLGLLLVEKFLLLFLLSDVGETLLGLEVELSEESGVDGSGFGCVSFLQPRFSFDFLLFCFDFLVRLKEARLGFELLLSSSDHISRIKLGFL